MRALHISLALAMLMAGSVPSSAQTQNKVAKFNNGQVADSSIFDNGNVGVGTITPTYKLDVGLGSNRWYSWNDWGAPAIAASIVTGPGIQKVNARASVYAVIAARNPGASFSVLMVPWDGASNLETNCNAQINPAWHAQAAIKGNHFTQEFDHSDFTQYSTVITSQAEFDTYKATGSQWWVGCSTLSSFSRTQWTASANDVNYTAGNVGIGTTSPNAKLHTFDNSNRDASLTYGAAAGAILNNGGVDIAFGTYNSAPFASWLQARTQANAANSFAINPLGGNVGIGTAVPGAKLEVAGDVKLSGGGSILFPDGSTQKTAWTGVLCGGDYAESVDVTGPKNRYEPGDVMVVDETNNSFAKSSEPYSTLVSGIYSTKPGVVGRKSTDPDKAQSEVPMAMIGIVPTKVSAENGPIRRGDLLVTSSTPGHAMKGTDRSRMLGAVVGKALGSLDSGTGVIDVLVTLQ